LLRQIQRLAQDLVLQGFLAEQPAQLANLLLQGPVLGGRHHLLAGTYCRQRALGVKPSPGEQLVWGDSVPTGDKRHRHPGRVGLLHDRRLLLRRPASPSLDRRNHLNLFDPSSHRHGHTPVS
jgi:hypothetical protein